MPELTIADIATQLDQVAASLRVIARRRPPAPAAARAGHRRTRRSFLGAAGQMMWADPEHYTKEAL